MWGDPGVEGSYFSLFRGLISSLGAPGLNPEAVHVTVTELWQMSV
jgi:hypothetical protein